MRGKCDERTMTERVHAGNTSLGLYLEREERLGAMGSSCPAHTTSHAHVVRQRVNMQRDTQREKRQGLLLQRPKHAARSSTHLMHTQCMEHTHTHTEVTDLRPAGSSSRSCAAARANMECFSHSTDSPRSRLASSSRRSMDMVLREKSGYVNGIGLGCRPRRQLLGKLAAGVCARVCACGPGQHECLFAMRVWMEG